MSAAFFKSFGALTEASNGVAKLRELILHLAFCGKLVRQIPAEGAARSVLNKIESVRRSRNGKMSKNQRLTDVAANEKPHDIPLAWEWVRLGEVVNYDCADKVAPSQIASDAWLLDLKDIEKDSSRIIQRLTFANRQSKSNKARFTVGDVLYGKLRPYLNKVIVADEDGYCTTEIVALRGYFGIEPKYLMYALKRPDFITYINAKSYGVKMPRLGRDDARLSVFPLPPVQEQKRIVTKVDELMRLCDELETRQQARHGSRMRLNNVTLAPLNNAASLGLEELEHACVRLSNNFAALYDSAETVSSLRSTILQLAVRGKLVSQDPLDEPASALIESVKKKKAQLMREKTIKREGPRAPINNDELPYSLPITWQWVRLEEISDVGTGSTPLSSNAEYYYQGTIAWVTSAVTSQDYIYDADTRITQKAVTDYRLRLYPVGTLLIALYGQGKTRGQISQLKIEATINQACAAVSPIENSEQHSSYIRMFFEKAYEEIRALAAGGAQPNLNLRKIKETLIPLPPLEEQKRIVAKVNQLMALCDELETKLRQAEADCEKLMNAAVRHVLDTIAGKEKSQSEIALALSSS